MSNIQLKHYIFIIYIYYIFFKKKKNNNRFLLEQKIPVKTIKKYLFVANSFNASEHIYLCDIYPWLSKLFLQNHSAVPPSAVSFSGIIINYKLINVNNFFFFFFFYFRCCFFK